MTTNTKVRFDERVERGQYQAIWLIRAPSWNNEWDEYLVALYSLTDDGGLVEQTRQHLCG